MPFDAQLETLAVTLIPLDLVIKFVIASLTALLFICFMGWESELVCVSSFETRMLLAESNMMESCLYKLM